MHTSAVSLLSENRPLIKGEKFMKRVLLMAIASVSFVGSAAAADLGVYKGPVTAPATVFNWTGFYVGGNVGGAWQDATLDPDPNPSNFVIFQATNFFVPGRGVIVVPATTRPLPSFDLNSQAGFIGGGQVGYNFQVQRWVLGIEGDIQTGGGRRSASAGTTIPFTALTQPALITMDRTVRTDWMASIRARVGYALWDRVMVYGTGGVAFADAEVTATDTIMVPPGPGAPNPGGVVANIGPLPPTVGIASASRSLVGWTAGVGGDWAVTNNIIVGLLYRHSDFGSQTYNITTNTGGQATTVSGGGLLPGMLTAPARLRLTDDQVTARISYRF